MKIRYPHIQPTRFIVHLNMRLFIIYPLPHGLLNAQKHVGQIDPFEPWYHGRVRLYLESSVHNRRGVESIWVWKHVDVTVLEHGVMCGRKTRFESAEHGGAADGIAGIDDDGELGLWDAVVDYLGGIQGVDVCVIQSQCDVL